MCMPYGPGWYADLHTYSSYPGERPDDSGQPDPSVLAGPSGEKGVTPVTIQCMQAIRVRTVRNYD